MAEADVILCEPCENNASHTPAITWCNDCGDGFCDECIKAHKVTKILRKHHLISVQDHLMAAGLSISETCPEHDKLFEFFCPQHDSILCIQCFQSNHSKCEILSLVDASKESKSSTALSELEHESKTIMQNLASGLRSGEEVLSRLNDEENIMCQKVKQTREEINKHLDKLQDKLFQDMRKKKNRYVTEINTVKTSLMLNKSKVDNVNKQISVLRTHIVSDKQTFIATREYEKVISQEKEAVKAELAKCNEHHIQLTIDQQVSNLPNTLKSFGDVVVETNARSVPFVDSNKKHAQRPLASITDINKITLQKRQSIRIHQTSSQQMSLTSCVILPNKTTVFVDNYNKSLIVHNGDGTHKTDIKVSAGLPFDITAVGGDNVAVSFGVGGVNVVNIETHNIENTFTGCFTGPVWGLSFQGGKFYVNEGTRTCGFTINIMDHKGNISKLLSLDSQEVYNITTHKDKLHYTSLDTRTLYACSESGKPIWTVCDDRLREPTVFTKHHSTSLCADHYGNIFLALPDSNQIMMISSDGQKQRIILDKSNNLEGPSGLSFLTETKQLLVCNVKNGHAALYDVKY